MNPLRMRPDSVTPPRGARVEVDGMPIHYVETGDGPTLLFVVIRKEKWRG